MKAWVTGTRVANCVRMLRNQFGPITFLIVEGETDRRFFGKFVDHEACRIEIGDGKKNVEDAIMILNAAHVRGIVGVVDADFMWLEGRTYEIPNLFVTDTHDIETLMLRSSALNNVLAEYADRVKLTEFEQKVGHIRDVLTHSSLWLGFLRWISLNNRWHYDFRAIEFKLFVDRATLTIDIQKLVDEVIERSSSLQVFNKDLLVEKLGLMMMDVHDPWQVCCGHDMVTLLHIGLSEIFGGYNARGLTIGALNGALRMCFGHKLFSETAIYRSLRDWECHSTPYKILNWEEDAPYDCISI